MANALMGKHILITGASRGLGMHIARAMWQEGASLLLVARSAETLSQVKDELIADKRNGQQAHVIVADLGTLEAIPTIMSQARRVWDRLDVLVNNAAILTPIGKVCDNDWPEWQLSIRVNLLAPVELCRACVPWISESREGKIINISGGGATRARPHFSAYATAKAGLVRFSETLAHEVRDSNIQVNCVAPGAMNTRMLQTVLRVGPKYVGPLEYTEAVKQAQTGGASPQRAAELCVFLASAASNGITGRLLSAVWDPWESLPEHLQDLQDSDIYTLGRITPADRGKTWK
jgi:NAD(P)-dependent dehydrogenase (short-subunit alcohol dehydrogenase family)